MYKSSKLWYYGIDLEETLAKCRRRITDYAKNKKNRESRVSLGVLLDIANALGVPVSKLFETK